MADENKTERVQLLMTPSEVKAIDDWSFENRIRGRAEAMRRLCQMGIALDAEAERLREMARQSTEGAKQATLLRMRDIKGELPDPMQANEALVDTIMYAARLSGHINRLTSASDLIKDPVSSEEIATYKEALQKLADERRSIEEAKQSGEAK